MSDIQTSETEQQVLLGSDAARSLLDDLIDSSRLYKTTKDYFELMKFISQMRNFAPFNAMLLNIQKPGLRFAASARDWRIKFGRTPKKYARPLLILWPFGPVALVYDVMDTEGDDIPEDVFSFISTGPMDDNRLNSIINGMTCKHIQWECADRGDSHAGTIRVIKRSTESSSPSIYSVMINSNHPAPVKFTSMAHELAHLYLGHLGSDKKLKIQSRRALPHEKKELEAESVAYLIGCRNGVTSKSQTYLTSHVKGNITVDNLDLYQIMRAAGQIEALLGLTNQTKFDKPGTNQTYQLQFTDVVPASQENGIGSSNEIQYGADNIYFCADKAGLIRTTLEQQSVADFSEMTGAGILLSGFHIEAGATSFIKYARAMVADVGDKVKPFLKAWYVSLQFFPECENFVFDSIPTVQELNLDDIFT